MVVGRFPPARRHYTQRPVHLRLVMGLCDDENAPRHRNQAKQLGNCTATTQTSPKKWMKQSGPLETTIQVRTGLDEVQVR